MNPTSKMLQPRQAVDVSVRVLGSLSQKRSPYSRITRLSSSFVAQVLPHLSTLVTSGLLCHDAGMDRVCGVGPSSSK